MDIEVRCCTPYPQGFPIVDDLITGICISLKAEFTITVAFLFEHDLISPDDTFVNL
jgi:hypothetical protein